MIYSIIYIIIVLAFFFIKHVNDTERPLFYPTSQDNLMLSCVGLCNLMDYSLPGSSVNKIIPARILEWAIISFSRGSSPPKDWTRVSCISCTAGFTYYVMVTTNCSSDDLTDSNGSEQTIPATAQRSIHLYQQNAKRVLLTSLFPTWKVRFSVQISLQTKIQGVKTIYVEP